MGLCERETEREREGERDRERNVFNNIHEVVSGVIILQKFKIAHQNVCIYESTTELFA